MSEELVKEFRRVINLTIHACQKDAYLEYTDKGYKAAKAANETAQQAREEFIKRLETLP